jgi:hypothetical protein
VREETREQNVDEEGLATARARVDQQCAVVVCGVERVDQRDLAAWIGKGERDPGRRSASGPDQRNRVADVARDVLARQARDVAAKRKRRLPELELAQLPEVYAGVRGRDDLPRGLLDRLGELDGIGFRPTLADRL